MMIPTEVMDAVVSENRDRLAAKDARIVELESALRLLRDRAHREVSPTYSAALDDAFYRADNALGLNTET
jgi:hypothetical protein